MIKLTLEKGDNSRTFFKSEPKITLGRSHHNQIVLNYPFVSSQHAEIIKQKGEYCLRDLDSTNGTSIIRDDTLILLKKEVERNSVLLQSGDIICLGFAEDRIRLGFEVVSQPSCQVEDEENVCDRLGDGRTVVISSQEISQLSAIETRIKSSPQTLLSIYDLNKTFQTIFSHQELLSNLGDQLLKLFPRADNLVVLENKDNKNLNIKKYFIRQQRGQEKIKDITQEMAGKEEDIFWSRTMACKIATSKSTHIFQEKGGSLSSASIVASGITSCMGAPLLTGLREEGKVKYVLQLNCGHQDYCFGQKDLDLLTLVVGQLSLNLENIELYSRLQEVNSLLERENQLLKQEIEQGERKDNFVEIIGNSNALRKSLTLLKRVMKSHITVLLEGETGTGKELFARALHFNGPRAQKLFVVQNCAAIPENLLESELFGHKKGAFTGVDKDKKGLFEVAHGGTIFLDEIGEMSSAMQAKLLRVCQEGEIRQVGALKNINVDIRIIAATNRSLLSMVEDGLFREDLFYRLSSFPILIPPLRDRKEDIPLLARHFLEKFCRQEKMKVVGMSREVLDILESYHYPGNVRQLQNEISRAAVLAGEGFSIQPDHLSHQVLDSMRKTEAKSAGNILDQNKELEGKMVKEIMFKTERELINKVMNQVEGNRTRAAQVLGISRVGLMKMLKRLELNE